jgi:hypothetical protein
MNKRQKLKKLKNDNEFMRKIINETAEMKRIYEAYNNPVKNIIMSTVNVKEYRSRKVIEPGIAPPEIAAKLCIESLQKEIIEIVKENIKYTTENRGDYSIITASIFIGN